MTSSKRRPRPAIYIALFAAWIAFAAWQYQGHVAQRRHIEETLHQQSHSVMSALLGGIRSHRRLGRFFETQLEGMLDELVAAQDVRAVRILAEDGIVILSAGEDNLLSEVQPTEPGHYWDPGGFRMVESFEVQPADTNIPTPGFGMGRGGQGRRQPEFSRTEGAFAEGGQFTAVLVLDRTRCDMLIQRSALLHVIVSAAGALVLLCLALAWRASVRMVEARGRARVLETETRYLRELGQAAAGLAHETRNPLGLIRGWTQRFANGEMPESDRQQHAGAIIEECDRVTARINQFIAFARPCEPETNEVDIREVTEELAMILEPDMELKNLKLDCENVPANTTIHADRELLRQAMFNLVQNAIQFAPENDIISVSFHTDQGTRFRIEVAERGPGVSDEAVGSLYTPYYTTRPDGTGLGLAIVRRIASAHGWQTGYRPRPAAERSFPSRVLMAERTEKTILIVDDEPSQRELLGGFVESQGYHVRKASSGEEALVEIGNDVPDMVLLDVRLPGINGIETLIEIRRLEVEVPVLLITAYADLRQAVAAMKSGADDYLAKPVDFDELKVAIADKLGTTADDLSSGPSVRHDLPDGFVCESPEMLRLVDTIAVVAPSEVPVLVTGESGTGKEVVANLIHSWSSRQEGPMLAANCASLPESLIESELFGHAEGAFTGASHKRQGLFRAADNGTLFLDEIGELPLQLQPKLLRSIETGQITPVGSDSPVTVNTRLIAATNRELEKEVAEGRFRDDLYYRINVVEIAIRPLRERREDILPLARHFAAGFSGGPIRLSPKSMQCLLSHPWPGNVRELRNAIQRACLLCRGDIIMPEHLPASLACVESQEKDQQPTRGRLSQVERATILATLEECGGNRTETAKKLGISRRGLLYKLRAIEAESE